MKRVSIIGPTDLDRLSELLGLSAKQILDMAVRVGEIIADAGHELWVNPDGGMLAAVAEAYKAHGGKKLVVLVPQSSDPWPTNHAQPYVQTADQVEMRPSWFHTNYAVVSEVDICICVGLSTGTFSELAYIKWDVKHDSPTTKLRKLLAVRELIRGGELPPEFFGKLGDVLRYVNAIEELSALLEERDDIVG
ncbi:MAG: hypothetical protein Q7R48_01040 [bacterium]|nr:hypothetical protein [bacterium]